MVESESGKYTTMANLQVNEYITFSWEIRHNKLILSYVYYLIFQVSRRLWSKFEKVSMVFASNKVIF